MWLVLLKNVQEYFLFWEWYIILWKFIMIDKLYLLLSFIHISLTTKLFYRIRNKGTCDGRHSDHLVQNSPFILAHEQCPYFLYYSECSRSNFGIIDILWIVNTITPSSWWRAKTTPRLELKFFACIMFRDNLICSR